MDVTGIETMTPRAKSPEPEAGAATPVHQAARPVSFANGAVKRHRGAAAAPAAVSYRECLRNHAAAMGGHSVDGCGEFAPSPSATAADPASLTCAACGCHRNFHRRDPEDPAPPPPHHAVQVIEYQPHHRHRPPPPPVRSPSSASPPPISSSYYPCAPRMLLALSSGGGASAAAPPGSASRKRFRTKFTPIQKLKMHEFADRIGWRLQKKDEDLIHEFCDQIGVDRVVLKVWMHNNKNSLGRRSDATNGGDEHHNHRHTEIQG